MGLKVGEVSLEIYNHLWKEAFMKEKEELLKLMGEIALSIEHVGSTSVEGLSAKPIIDIAVGVNSLSDFNSIKNNFLSHPEYSIKDDSDSDEILVRKGPEDNRRHFIHIMEIESPRYKNTLLFRDYLKNNPAELKKYENLKKELAQKYPNNRKIYTSSKNEMITEMLRKERNK